VTHDRDLSVTGGPSLAVIVDPWIALRKKKINNNFVRRIGLQFIFY